MATESNDSSLKDKKSDEDILATARKRFQLCVDAENATRLKELDDLRFMNGDQWPQEIRAQREADNRPCLTINRLPQYVHQITNDQRQNRPSTKINPADDDATVETAKILQGMVRHIEYASRADLAIDIAFKGGAANGIGFYRLITEYSDPMSFQQEIRFKSIEDRFSVYLDPHRQEPDGSDSKFGFIVENMPKDEFEHQYPKAELSNMGDWEGLNSTYAQWIEKDFVRVAEYYTIDYEDVEIVLFSDGSVLERDEIPEELPEGVQETSSRITQKPKVKWYKINGQQILERTEIPGKYIPIFPVIGEENIVDGKKEYNGIIRYTKEPQKMYNFMTSAEAEIIALAPKSPYIGAEGQFEGHEEQWAQANVKNMPFLQYKPVSLNGTPVPPPQRQSYEPAVMAVSQSRIQYGEELKATTGIYDATLGNRSNEQSGVAIQRRNNQAQTSNFHYIDNLSRTLRHSGRVIVSWLPKIYDTPQAARIIGEDGTVEMTLINQLFDEGGVQKGHFLDLGTYDVTVDTGPSFQTKRQEAVASMLDLLRSVPQVSGVILDLMVRSMDWPHSQEIADRLKKMLPPQLQDDKKDKQMPIPPQVQQQLEQMQQMIQVMSKHLEEDADIIKNKKLELDNKLQIAAIQAETQLKVELLKHDAKDGQLAFQEEMREIQHMRDTLTSQSQILNNGPGGDYAAGGPSNNTQPTDGQSSGQPMGETP